MKRTMRCEKDTKQDPQRCLDCNSLSTTGLMLWLSVVCSNNTKGKRAACPPSSGFFDILTQLCGELSTKDISIDINLEEGALVDVGCRPPKVGRWSLDVSQGMVDFTEWGCPGLRTKLLKAHGVSVGLQDMKVNDFLVMIAGHRNMFPKFACQIFVGIGQWLEVCIRSKLMNDPVQVTKCTTKPLAKVDGNLADILALGEATVNSDEPGVTNVSTHVSGAATFGNMRNFDVGKRWAHIMTRYWFAGRKQFSHNAKIAIACDGSSFQEDSMLGIMAAKDTPRDPGDRSVRTMVLPPQAILQI